MWNKKTPKQGNNGKTEGHDSWIERIWNLPRQVFAQNTGTKLLSLTLAILFWFFVMDHVDPEISRVFENVPIQLVNTQELDQNNLKIMNQSDYFVDVEVVGRRNDVLNMNSKSIYLWADLRSVSNGINKILVNSSVNSDSVSIKLLSPKEIIFTIDRVISVSKPIEIVFKDFFEESLYQESMEVKPFEINVIGPESLVNSVDKLIGTITVNAINEDYTKEVTLSPYTEDGVLVDGVNLQQNTAQLTLKVGKQQEVKLVSDVQGNPKDGYEIVSVKVNPEDIKIRGEVNLVSELEVLMTEPLILTGDESETIVVEKEILIPEGIEVENGKKTVQVELIIEPIEVKEFSFDFTEFELKNLNSSFEIEQVSANHKVVVRLTDIASKISGIKREDLIPYIDFSNITSIGDYRLKINLPETIDVKEISIDPISIDLKIVEKSAEN